MSPHPFADRVAVVQSWPGGHDPFMQTYPKTPEVITATEASQLLAVSSRTVRRLIAGNELPAIRRLPGRGGDWLLYRRDVEEYVNQLRVVSRAS
jgi:excisionase family DNA binding protein